MKLFIIVVVSVIVCCNAQDEPTTTIQLLKAIVNETRVARELQHQQLNELIDKVELLINETQNTRLDQNTCCDITNDSLGRIYNELHSTRQEAQDYHEVAQQWYTQPNVFVSFASCEDIKTMSPSAPSGYYNITKYDGTTQRVYCDIEHSHQSCNGSPDCMTEHCGSTGWTRVAYLNMSDPSQQCPTELRLYSESGVRACGRQTLLSGSCDSITFSTNGTRYSKVCGRVIGYQYGITYAFNNDHYSIDSYYVDGISITHGSPRQHIWTLAAGASDYTDLCPCTIGSTQHVPLFVGDDYFCESGRLTYRGVMLYTDDPLWDGEGCTGNGNEGPCCYAPGIPWFHKVLNSPTTDTIELRVCARYNDAPVSLYELYVK